MWWNSFQNALKNVLCIFNKFSLWKIHMQLYINGFTHTHTHTRIHIICRSMHVHMSIFLLNNVNLILSPLSCRSTLTQQQQQHWLHTKCNHVALFIKKKISIDFMFMLQLKFRNENVALCGKKISFKKYRVIGNLWARIRVEWNMKNNYFLKLCLLQCFSRKLSNGKYQLSYKF